LGWDTFDTYPSSTGSDANITKQAICWAATGTFDCKPKTVIDTNITTTPFYTNFSNPQNITLNRNESTIITFWINATGVLTNYSFQADAVRTNDILVTNSTNQVNISIIASSSGPSVTIIIPSANTFTNNTNQDVNFTASSETLDSCWYSNDSMTTNISLANCVNITSVIWSEGSHSVTIWANDSNNNKESATVNFTIDTTNPSIIINFPNNNTNSTNNALNVNYTIFDTNVDTCWYSNDSMTTNTTLAGCSNITSVTWSEGQHNLTIWINDSVNNINSSSIYFGIDSINPTWTGNKTNLTSFSTSNVYFNITLNDANADQYIFGFYNGTNWINDSTSSFNNGLEISIIKNISQNGSTLNWTWYFNDTFGNQNQTSIWSVYIERADTIKPLIDFSTLTPNNATIQTQQNVKLNFSIEETNIKKITYNWNGTNYTLFNDSLILFMNFDNYSAIGENSTFVIDNSNFGNNGTVSGAKGNVTGRYHSQFEFDGNDYINLSNPSSLDVNQQTVSAWLKTNIVNSAWHFAYGTGSNNWGANFGISQNDKWGTEFQNTSTSAILLEGSAPVVGQWMHLVFTYNGTTAVLYENGRKVNHSFITGDMYITSQYYIGRKHDGNFGWDGSIDELRIWNRSLSSSEVYQTYTSNLRKYDTNKWELYVNQSKNATNLLSDGDYTYFTYAKDTSGNQNKTILRTITLDSTSPSLSITSPSNNSNSSNSQININYTVFDTNLDQCWYSNDSMTTNTTLSGCSNITSITWSEGQHNVTIWVNDSTGNVNSSSITFTIDTTNPSIIINYPNNNTNSTNNVLNVNYTIFDNNVDTCWYSNDSMTTNTTLAGCSNITSITWKDGEHNVTIWVNDSAGNVNSSSVTFTIDTTSPVTTLVSPTAHINSSTNPLSFNFNCSVTDNIELKNISLYITNKTNQSFVKNQSALISGTNTSAQWTLSLKTGNYTWNCLSYDNAGNSNWSINRSLILNGTTDTDGDGIIDNEDGLLYNESAVNASGFTRLNITIGGNRTNNSYTGKKQIKLYDRAQLIVNFTHNFTRDNLDLSKIKIIKAASYILINASTEIQGNKTIYLDDSEYTTLCVKDQEINTISEMSSDCTGVNETDFTSCIDGQTTINGITCIDQGSKFEINNLQHSAVRGTVAESSSSSSSSSTSSGGGGSISTGISTKKDKPNELVLRLNLEYPIYIKSENHVIKIIEIKDNNVKLLFNSKQFVVDLNFDKNSKLDFNEDGIYDIMFTLLDINNDKIVLRINEIDENYKEKVINEAKEVAEPVIEIKVEEPKQIIEEKKNYSKHIISTIFIYFLFYLIYRKIKRPKYL